MELLEYHFIMFQYLGFWRPTHWPPGWKCYLYDSYTLFVLILLVTICLSEFTQLVIMADTIETLTSNSFMLLTMITACGKGINLVNKRREIVQLITSMRDNPYRPTSDQELTIQRNFHAIARFNFSRFLTLVTLTFIAITLQSLLWDVSQRTLPFESWIPFDYRNSLLSYLVVYSYQIFTLATAAFVSASFDTLLPGLMLEACAQLNVLKNRFDELPSLANKSLMVTDNKSNFLTQQTECRLLSQCVRHHLEILKFTNMTNSIFSFIIFVQYMISALVLCANVFYLSRIEVFDLDCLSRILYLICLLMQIYMYCYYGCKVSYESLDLGDAIYEMDWNSLSIRTRKDLMTILVRTLRPIKYISFNLISLDLESLKSLLKVSYSTYNLLQQT